MKEFAEWYSEFTSSLHFAWWFLLHCSFRFLGDNAFPLKPYAGRRQLPVKQSVFNYRLSRVRSVIENAFGILQQEISNTLYRYIGENDQLKRQQPPHRHHHSPDSISKVFPSLSCHVPVADPTYFKSLSLCGISRMPPTWYLKVRILVSCGI